MPARALIDVAWQALTEWADEKQMDRIRQAVADHEARLTVASLAASGRPWWWDDDADADAAAFLSAFR